MFSEKNWTKKIIFFLHNENCVQYEILMSLTIQFDVEYVSYSFTKPYNNDCQDESKLHKGSITKAL